MTRTDSISLILPAVVEFMADRIRDTSKLDPVSASCVDIGFGNADMQVYDPGAFRHTRNHTLYSLQNKVCHSIQPWPRHNLRVASSFTAG